ncbi:MAG: gas vesicle protein GvpFL [Desulfobacteraceae bacterium]|nr:MAG: gas vesicle protein GvpFL [Desulfobacteraceae bacterium]
MAAQSPDHKGKYLYAVIAGAGGRNLETPGIDNGTLHTISEGKISAVVSDVPNKKLRPERRHLAAHQSVLRRLMEECTPLPMAFGIIADGSQAIRRILTLNQEAFREALDHVTGKVEIGLRVTWDVPNIFDYFVNTHPELRAVRDRYFGTNREPAHEDKLALGRMFDNLLNEEREIHTEKVEEILYSVCFEINRNSCRSELEVMSLACLVGRDKAEQKAFEKGILEAANLFDNNYAFDYNGPWAPHNFVAIDLQM